MPGICKAGQMAECLNRGLGLADNEDLRQAMLPGVPIIADMMFRDLCRNDGNHREYIPVQGKKHKNNRVLSPSSSTSEDELYAQALSIHENYDSKMQAENDKTNNIICQKEKNELVEVKTEKIVTETVSVRPKVPSNQSSVYFLPVNYNQRNPWRRMIGLHASGDILKNATYPLKSRVQKPRFAQAKKPLSYLYSYFSVEILEYYEDKCGLTIGLSRKDYPSKIPPGQVAGSLGYNSDTGTVAVRDIGVLNGPSFSKGDVIGCGIIYPSHYKCYADLSTDDNSDGMTDVVLTSLLNVNKKSMDFVRNILNLNFKGSNELSSEDDNSDDEFHAERDQKTGQDQTTDLYYNENYVESRTQVEVYFTYNMQVIGKVLTHIPVGGFYPTVHIISSSALKLSVDLNPPSS